MRYFIITLFLALTLLGAKPSPPHMMDNPPPPPHMGKKGNAPLVHIKGISYELFKNSSYEKQKEALKMDYEAKNEMELNLRTLRLQEKKLHHELDLLKIDLEHFQMQTNQKDSKQIFAQINNKEYELRSLKQKIDNLKYEFDNKRIASISNFLLQ